jgi:hypothetical protein
MAVSAQLASRTDLGDGAARMSHSLKTPRAAAIAGVLFAWC